LDHCLLWFVDHVRNEGVVDGALHGLLAVLLDARGKVREDLIFLIAVSILAYRFQTELTNLSARQQNLAWLISLAALVAVVFFSPGSFLNQLG
jgi:hypothetical protein